MFDIQEKVEELVKKIMGDKILGKSFLSDPAKTVESLLGVDLPDETLRAVIEGVKGKINVEKLSAMLDSDGDGKPDLGLLGKLGKLFGKK